MGRATSRARGAESKRRAQMYLVQLRWLEGFAADDDDGALRWWPLDGAPPFALEGAALARARRTMNTLTREHADVLAALVGDVEAWVARVDAALRLLGERVHRRTTGDPAALVPVRLGRAARELVAAEPALAPVVAAAVLAGITAPDELARVLRWMRARTAVLAALVGEGTEPEPERVRRVLRLARLAEDGEAGVDALIELALVDAPDPAQARAYLERARCLIEGHEPGEAAAPATGGPVVRTWIDRLCTREPDERRRSLALYARVRPAEVLAPWRTWWAQHRPRVERAAALAQQRELVDPLHVARMIAALEEVRQDTPPVVDHDGVLIDLEVLARAALEPFHRALLRLFASLPPAHATPLARIRLLTHAAHVAACADDRKPAWLWEAVADALDGGAPARVLDLWERVWRGEDHHWLDEQVLAPLTKPAEVRRFAAALVHCAAKGETSREAADRAAALVAAGLDPDATADVVRRLARVHGELQPAVARAAVALAGGEVAPLAARLEQLLALGEDLDSDEVAHLCALIEHVAAAGAGWLVDATLAATRTKPLREAAALAALVPRRSWPRVMAAEPAAHRWIAAYPPALHAALARLASVDPDGEGTARRRLAADLPAPAALEREAAALRARAPLAPRAAARLRTLDARIATPPTPSPVRLAKLAAKLEAAAATIGLARLTAALTAAATAKVVAALGLDPWPGWELDARGWALLIALGRLDGPARALAVRLLRARTGPPPWDLRDAPANRAFLDRLRARGADPAPWLDDAPRSVKAADGKPVELALAHDPLEVFAMGAHFQTCLSPGSHNYFSVVANAADVNKRVLYARRDGAIVGRCLLALTDAGGILTFHPYAHDGRLGFDGLVRELALDLAARMGTVVVPRGAVSTLLADDWYDDGPHDLVGRFAALNNTGLATELETIEPGRFVARIEAAVGHRLDDLVLPLVIELGVFARRPELVRALEPLLRAHPTLPDRTVFRAAELALRAGAPEVADRLVAGRGARVDLDHHPWFLGHVLARTRPELALARLRATRARGVRGWADERGDRIAVAAAAMETLRRPRQAAELYRLAIADAPYLREELTARLAALESRHG